MDTPTQNPKTSEDTNETVCSAEVLAWQRDYYARNREKILTKEKKARQADPAFQKRQRERQREYERRALEKEGRENRRRRMRASEEKLRESYPWRTCFYECKQRAKSKGLPFDLTQEWFKSKWEGKCELTGIAFVIGNRKRTVYTASVDRIDNSLGYVQSNCRVILLGLNMLKFDSTDEDMYKIAEALVKNRRS